MVDGRLVDVVAADTDVNVIIVPASKILKITTLTVTNHNPAAARVRIWDTFTDSGATVHSSAANEVKIRDLELQPGETYEIYGEKGIGKAIGTIVAQSDVAAAAPNHVSVGVFGEFE